MELTTYIYNLLFDWVSTKADFEEMVWFSFWMDEM